MTMLTHVDRLLGSVLEADGPQALPPGLVDAALTEARTLNQRRPFLRVLDQLAWPPLIGPRPRRATRRVVAIALVALLAIAALAAAVLVGTTRPPQVLGDAQRAYVWHGDTAYLLTAGTAVAHSVTPGRATNCPTLIAGTTAIARFGYGGWELVDVVTDAPVSSVEFNTAGMERWSPDARRMAIMDAAGRVGIATFEDLAAPVTTWFDAPGVQSIDWSQRGDRLAFTTQVGLTLTVEILDVVSGERLVAYRTEVAEASSFANGPWRDVRWSSDGATIVIQVGTATDMTTVTLIDTGAGRSQVLAGITGSSGSGAFLGQESALTADGTAIALVRSPTEVLIADPTGTTLGAVPTTQPARSLAWSANGQLLAFLDGDALVMVAREGTARRIALVGAVAAFRWDGPDIVVATAQAGGVTVERYETDKLTPVARFDSTESGSDPSPAPAPSAVVGEIDTICLQLDYLGPSPPGDP